MRDKMKLMIIFDKICWVIERMENILHTLKWGKKGEYCGKIDPSHLIDIATGVRGISQLARNIYSENSRVRPISRLVDKRYPRIWRIEWLKLEKGQGKLLWQVCSDTFIKKKLHNFFFPQNYEVIYLCALKNKNKNSFFLQYSMDVPVPLIQYWLKLRLLFFRFPFNYSPVEKIYSKVNESTLF